MGLKIEVKTGKAEALTTGWIEEPGSSEVIYEFIEPVPPGWRLVIEFRPTGMEGLSAVFGNRGLQASNMTIAKMIYTLVNGEWKPPERTYGFTISRELDKKKLSIELNDHVAMIGIIEDK